VNLPAGDNETMEKHARDGAGLGSGLAFQNYLVFLAGRFTRPGTRDHGKSNAGTACESRRRLAGAAQKKKARKSGPSQTNLRSLTSA